MKRVLISIAAVVAAFLAGFVPQFLDKRDAGSRLEEVSRLSGHRLLRLELATLLVEVEQGRSAQARDMSTAFFDHLHAVTERASEERQPTLKAILDRRDEITADLTAANPETVNKLRAMFVDLSRALPEGPATANQ
jgi:hypothetical protein